MLSMNAPHSSVGITFDLCVAVLMQRDVVILKRHHDKGTTKKYRVEVVDIDDDFKDKDDALGIYEGLRRTMGETGVDLAQISWLSVLTSESPCLILYLECEGEFHLPSSAPVALLRRLISRWTQGRIWPSMLVSVERFGNLLPIHHSSPTPSTSLLLPSLLLGIGSSG